MHIYEACSYAYSHTSAKWCKLQSTILPQLAGLKHLSTDSTSSSFSCISHFIHCFWILSGIVSSHPKFSLHSCWITTFPWRRKGVTNPKGSKTQLITDSRPLLVHDFCFKVTLNPNLSVYVSHSTRNACSAGKSPMRSLSSTHEIHDFPRRQTIADVNQSIW